VSFIQKVSVIFVAAIILIGSLGYAYYRRVQEQAKDEFTKNTAEVIEEEKVMPVNMVMVEEVLPGDTVTVKEAYLEAPGFVVVYEDDGGTQGEVIGVSDYLEEGSVEGEEITLDRNVEGGELLYVMLYEDDGDEEWSEADGPVIDDEEKVVTQKVTVQEEEIEEATEEAELEE